MILRIIAILLLSFVGLVGLGMSLCGGVMTLTGLAAQDGSGSELYAMSYLMISVPSLLVGAAIVYGVFRGFRRIARKPVAGHDERRSEGSGSER